MLDWAKREVELACKRERIQIESRENGIMGVLVMKAH